MIHTELEFRTEVQYWGGNWVEVTERSSDIPARAKRGESLDGIRIRTVARKVTRSDWFEITKPVNLSGTSIGVMTDASRVST